MVQKNLKNKIINLKMKKGKKHLCEKQLFNFFKLFQKKNKKNINSLIKSALTKITPIISIKKVTRNTDDTVKKYPYVLKKNQRISLSIKQLIKPPSLLKYSNIEDWVNILSERFTNKISTHNEALQEKKLLKYRWFF